MGGHARANEQVENLGASHLQLQVDVLAPRGLAEGKQPGDAPVERIEPLHV